MKSIALTQEARTDQLTARAAEIDRRILSTRKQLADALLGGRDTAGIREFLEEDEREATQVAADQRTLAAELEREAEAQLDVAADAIAVATIGNLNTQIAMLGLPASITTEDSKMPMPKIAEHHEDAIKSAAAVTAAAQAGLATATAALAAANSLHTTIATRIAEKNAARGAIIMRRSAGDHQPSDGADLALIAADSEALAAALAEAEAGVAKRRGPHRVAQQALVAAQQGLAEQSRAAMEEALIKQATALDGALLGLVHAIEGVRDGNAGRPKWGPSAELRTALRRLSSMRYEL